jgi:hypothetical protein
MITQKVRTWTQNKFACWLLLVFSTTFTSGFLASLAPFSGQSDLHDLQNDLSSKVIWSPKTTLDKEIPVPKSVAPIPTNIKLPLNPLWDVWFLSNNVFCIFAQFEDEILQVFLTCMKLSRLSSLNLPSFGIDRAKQALNVISQDKSWNKNCKAC